MDQTDFSLLAGLAVGFPVCLVALGLTALPGWARVLIALPVGTLSVAIVVYAAIGWLGRRSSSGDGNADKRPPGVA